MNLFESFLNLNENQRNIDVGVSLFVCQFVYVCVSLCLSVCVCLCVRETQGSTGQNISGLHTNGGWRG